MPHRGAGGQAMNRWIAATGLVVAGAALVSTRPKSRTGAELREIFRDDDFQLTGVTVSPSGRMFVNYPRWSDMYLNAVVEVMPDGSADRFPTSPGTSGTASRTRQPSTLSVSRASSPTNGTTSGYSTRPHRC